MTSTRTVRQNASVVPTLFDLLIGKWSNSYSPFPTPPPLPSLPRPLPFIPPPPHQVSPRRCPLRRLLPTSSPSCLISSLPVPFTIRHLRDHFRRTVSQMIKESTRREYWASHSSLYSFNCTAYSFAGSALLALLARSAALICPLAHLLPSSWDSGFCS